MKLKINKYYVIKKKICTNFCGYKYCRNGTIINLVTIGDREYHFEFILNDKNKKLVAGCSLHKHDINKIKSLTWKDKIRLVAGLL